MRKPRILFVNEASYLNTGFSIYGKELLSRLYKTQKYTIAEFASYGNFKEVKSLDLPWRWYPNTPTNEQENQEYNSSPYNSFGAWRLNDVLLDFKPDFVVGIRDPWMDSILVQTPYKKLFHLVLMPTVDSDPQQETWINDYLQADTIFTYSEYGKRILEEQSGGKIKVRGVPSPSINFSDFNIISDKIGLRKHFGIPDKAFVIGTVMRNQRRKLYPELFRAFSKFHKLHPETAKNTYLYCHTSFPDVGWDIPRLIKESDVGHKILFTYICQNCKAVFPSVFKDARCICHHCGQYSAILPNTQCGAETKQLAQLYNLMDLYVQFSICEGFGIGQVEAAACGVPIMSVNYSAMESALEYLKGIPINVELLFRECETHMWRSYPNEADFIEKLNKFINKPSFIKDKAGREAFLASQRRYNWENTAKIWEKLFDEQGPQLILENRWETTPPHINNPETQVPHQMSNEDLVRWGMINVLGDYENVNGFLSAKLTRDLNYGYSIQHFGGSYFSDDSWMGQQARHQPFNPNDALNILLQKAQERNYWEAVRVGAEERPKPQWMQFVKPGDDE